MVAFCTTKMFLKSLCFWFPIIIFILISFINAQLKNPYQWRCDRILQKCYMFTPITGTWSEIAGYCSKVGNGLATIHSKYENDIVTDVASPAIPPPEMNISIAWVFIGLNRFSDGRYYWNDGSIVNYTNWNPFQPNSDAPFVALNPRGGRIEITGTGTADDFIKGMWDDIRPNHGPNGTGAVVNIAGVCQKPFFQQKY